MDTRRPRRWSRLWIWPKVFVLLVAVDAVLFGGQLFWRTTPDFADPNETQNQNWRYVYETARAIETGASGPSTVVVIGSSILRYGLDENAVNAALQKRGVPVRVLPLLSLGSTATDSALVAWKAQAIDPWLVIYTAALRDFSKQGIVDSAVRRTFYDSSIELPLWPRENVEDRISASLRRYWRLYRYRFFARRAVTEGVHAAVRSVTVPAPAQAAEPDIASSVPPEAYRYFASIYVTPEMYAAWEKWRRSQTFADYLAWLQIRGAQLALNLYKTTNVQTCSIDGNPHAEALDAMLTHLEQARIAAAIVYFPENPVFRLPGGAEFFDPVLSQDYAEFFAAEARLHGDRFEDWRGVLEGEDFYDMIHVNLVGRLKLTEHFVDLIESEWRARARRDVAAEASS